MSFQCVASVTQLLAGNGAAVRYTLLVLSAMLSFVADADSVGNAKSDVHDAFRQLDELPTPNLYRAASGAPGPRYWQQQVDYDIEVRLDENAKRISGSETVTYTNNSPDTLRYLWIQLDQNIFRSDSIGRRSEIASSRSSRGGSALPDLLSYFELAREQAFQDVDYGYEIERVSDLRGNRLSHTVVDTMMRVDLPEPLAPGKHTSFSVDWSFNIVDERVAARSGYEYFAENQTYLFFIAQWFPRLAAYTDYGGWQIKPFLGAGEFTLEFGNYKVAITVPDGHIVSATGVLQNPSDVLTPEQRRRLDQARRSTENPIFIVTPEEAATNERNRITGTKTWVFRAENVRDFAWTSSRKFIWDAMVHHQNDREHPEVLVMSFYPNEAEPIWSKYSSRAVVHAIEVYSRFCFPYPYPTAQSVNTWKTSGMEYPMITFNGYRPKQPGQGTDGQSANNAPGKTWSRELKYRLIGVIVHEIGHTYFPMTVNSDERQWAWMDEGINSLLTYIASLEWEENFPAYGNRANVLDYIPEYMSSEDQVPIMTQADSVRQLIANSYVKPTAALVVLRELVMGREQFDFAFREYARRWKFRRPTPAEFFRTMEDASGLDLDWFWRGWFYSTDHVDVSIGSVRQYKVSTDDPDVEFGLARDDDRRKFPEPLQQSRDREEGRATNVDQHSELRDIYNEYDRFTVTDRDRESHRKLVDSLEDWERGALKRAARDDQYVYFIDFANVGGLPTPLPLLITYASGDTERLTLPAEIWRLDGQHVTKMLIRKQRIEAIELDPQHATGDADLSNNLFPRGIEESRIDLYKEADREPRDLMQDQSTTSGNGKGEAADTDARHVVPVKPAEPGNR